MTSEKRFSGTIAIAFALVMVSALLVTPVYAVTSQARSLGPENPSKVMTVQVTLNLRNKAQLDALVQGLHDQNSPNYKKFITRDQFASQYAPTAADAQKVADYLKANGLTVINIAKNNLFVSATGSVATLEKTFNTKIEIVQQFGQTFNRPMSAPAVAPSVAPLVKNISGLQNSKLKPYFVRAMDPKTKKPFPAVKYTKTKPLGLVFPSNCFSVNNSVYNLYGSGLQAIYSGNGYPAMGCGYDAAELQHAYGFDTVIKGGIDGTGQIIFIVDAYGSYSILADANTYSAANGLPALVPGVNFAWINNPIGNPPDCAVGPTTQCGWEFEVTLDVELAHAMAPGATIVLVTTPTQNDYDFVDVDYWITQVSPQPATASHSYGEPETVTAPADHDNQYLVNEIADGMGFAYNYSSGDSGDFYDLGLIGPYPDVSFPSGSPNATSVGGTSLAVDQSGTYKWEEGWGTNATWLNVAPPLNFGFQYGAGGGTSLLTPAPSWQAFYLHNTWRQQPDVAFTADPFTGAEIIYTGDFNPGDQQYITVIGGTSLACPMFSGVWALATQKTGAPTGNAAPTAYAENALFPGSFNDVKPVGSGHNAHGTIFYNNVPAAYSQWDLAQPYQNSPTFYEVLWSPNYLYTLTFGTDTSLDTAPGWDNVTGIGTPAGGKFIAPF